MHSIVVFASGTGTNAKAIIDFFKNTSLAKVVLIVCNNPRAGVLDIADSEKIPVMLIRKENFQSDNFLKKMNHIRPALLVLAGFLWKIPENIVRHFKDKIINIHPALLPKYGGKGMYGDKVHQQVMQAKDKETGITIHYANEHYDEGHIILQARCRIEATDSIDRIKERVHRLEHFYYPRAIAFLLSQIPETQYKNQY